MNALVTGAGGFVGAAVVRALLRDGTAVRALVRAGSDARNLDGLAVERVEGDITDPSSLGAAVKGCSVVFHVAADYRLWVPDPKKMYATNVQGSLNVLEAAAAAGAQRVVHTSSVATLGLNEDRSPADEQSPSSLFDMIGHYKRSKFLAEQAVRERAQRLGIALVIVNPSTPVGPGDVKPTPTGRIILEAAAGRMPAYVETGLNVVHVDDVALGHLLAARHGVPGERYILGGIDMSLREILTVVARHAGRRPPRLRVPAAAVLPVAYLVEGWARIARREPWVTVDGVRMATKHMYFSSAKAARDLGYTWRPAEQAIADAIAWFKQQNYL